MNEPIHTAKIPRKNSRFSALHRGSVLLLVAGASGLLFACSYGLNPITPLERTEILTNDRTALFSRQEAVTRPISLFEAMARALKYNLSHRVALLEKTVAQRQLDLSQFELLPQMAATADIKARSNPEASKGYSITDQTASDSYSTAQDRSKNAAKLTTAWNVLDFGVSAIQARQDADRISIANENQRKAVHTLLQEVRSTFWRAAGAQKLADAIGPVIQQARNALVDARQVEQERLKPQLEILRFQKTLLEIVRQLQELRHQLSLAKTEFAALLNLPPGSDFQLDIPDDPALTIPEIRMTIEEMEAIALDNRPDVREAMYTARISRGDVRKALLRLLPGLEFQLAHNWESNSFAMNAQWEEASARVAMNILNILQGPTTIRMAENRESLAEMRRLTLHMAILTQVHLAYHQYVNDQGKLRAVEEIDAVDQRIFKNFSLTTGNDAQSRLEYISAAASAIMSRLQLYQAYADAQNSVGRIFVTLGVDLAPKATRSDKIEHLTDAMREASIQWDEGVSSTPLQKLLDSLSKPATVKGVEPGREGQHAIPEYFLDPQFLSGIADNPVAGEDEVNNALLPTDSAPSRIFGAKDRQTVTQPAAAAPAKAQPTEKKSPPAQQLATKAAESKPEKQAAKPAAVGSDKAGGEAPVAAAGEKAVDAGESVAPGDPKLLAEVQEMLGGWAQAWSQRNLERYWGFYAGEKFVPPNGQSLDVWRKRTRDTLHALTFLRVEISNLEIVRELPEPLAGMLKKGSIEFIQVAFHESYRSSHVQSFARKLMILGKEADGWKIYREMASLAPRPGSAVPLGYAVQVAAMEMAANTKTVLEEWSARGFKPTVVAVLNEKKQRHNSIRVAHFREREPAQFFRWLLQIATGVDSLIVPAVAAEMGREVEPSFPKGEAEQRPQPQGSVDQPLAKQEPKNVSDQQPGKGAPAKR
ncbi:MAG: TolC family protein [Magnetococcales bacterium]|nr:TolC family protein [Magnetococcales bacterium]